ncbi:phage head spike fiber domain-containing protein [Azospirillum argentinense]|uniref:Uncharacterized protein n=1 Tax=Azospirillum brasilense TaxID=192 RepID=A0A4D8PZ65_AZOBR|nr:hypothetical protein [Azospirillum argentinense]QCO03025.1 hypothetical protein D3867_13990 [Azospirillum argentinense]
MANALFGFGNLIDLPATVLSCGSARSNLPVSNLADPDPQRPWVTQGTTRDWAHADFGAPQLLRLLGLFGALLTGSAQVRWRLGTRPMVDDATVDFDFTTEKPLDPRLTFTRSGSRATRVNSAGLIETVPDNVPRFDYDPITRVCLGLLIEEARVNRLRLSQDFTGINGSARWFKYNTAFGFTADWFAYDVANAEVMAPDGTYSSCKVTKLGTSNLFLRQYFPNSYNVLANTTYAASFYVYYPSGPSFTVDFNNDGWVTNTPPISASPYWQRITAIVTIGSTVTGTPNMFDAETGAPVGTTFWVWGFQFEVCTSGGAFATSYIATTTDSVGRNADVLTLPTSALRWYEAGTLYFETRMAADRITSSSFRYQGLLANAPTNIDAVSSQHRADGRLSVGTSVATVSQGSIAAPTSTVGQVSRTAIALRAGDAAVSWNGSAATSLPCPVMPTAIDTVYFGRARDGNALGCLNGHFRRFKSYARRVADADLPALSGAEAAPVVGDLLDTGWVGAAVATGYWHTLHILPAAVSARYLRVDIDDPARATTAVNGQAAGDLITGRLWASDVIQPMRNISYPFNERQVPMDTKQRGKRSGAVSVDPGATYREISFGYEALSQEEARGTFKEFLRRVGIREQLVFIPEPGSVYQPTEAILGRQAESTPMTWAQFAMWSHSMTIEEDPALGA